MNFQQMFEQLTGATGRLKSQIPYLPKAFGLVYRAAGGLTIAWLALLLVQGLLPVAMVYLTKTLVDGVATMIANHGGWEGFTPLIPAAVAMAAVLISIEIFQSINQWMRTAQSEKVQDAVHELIHDKAMSLDMSFYDTPVYYDQLYRARIDALTRPAALIENAGSLLQSLITLIAMAGVLLTFGIWIPILLALSTLPALVVVMRHTLRFHLWRLRNTTAIRKTNYYDMMLTSREAAEEMRLFSLGPHFRNLFSNLRGRLRREKVQLARSEAFSTTVAALIGLASMAVALAWMGLQASRGTLSLGDLALFVQAFFQGQRMMRSLLGSAGEIYRNMMFLENLFEFLELKPQISSPEKPIPHPGLKKGIEIQNVTFNYPGSERLALDNFSLDIPAGQIVALVGENGAGKTTLIKMLCRFYDPETGCVLLDKTEIRNLSLEGLRRRITVLFQEPVRYHDTVFNNIAFGDIENQPDSARIEAAAQAAGADAPLSRLPHTYASVLGKWFGGAELSSGEWQRLALARAFLRQAELIILDEPTSSMDSWAEADWMIRFRKLAAGRTALIITHRFTTAMQADTIHVMERGRIIESGSHEELLAAGGRYALSWTQQMRGRTTDT
ncbi:MAG: ABC transporter ATP-binding protein [Clostridiaceae bacterium]